MDFIPLAKILRTEADIRTAQVGLDAVGMIVENNRCTQIPNSLISLIDTLERRQLIVLISISFNQIAYDSRTINAIIKGDSQVKTALDYFGIAGLITQAH